MSLWLCRNYQNELLCTNSQTDYTNGFDECVGRLQHRLNKEWYIHFLTCLCICYVNIFYERRNHFYRCILSGQVFCSYINQKYIKIMQWKIKVNIWNIYVHEQNNSKQIWINEKKGWDERKKTWLENKRMLTSCLVSWWLCSIKTKFPPFTTDIFFSLARLIEDLKRVLSSAPLSSVLAP